MLRRIRHAFRALRIAHGMGRPIVDCFGFALWELTRKGSR